MPKISIWERESFYAPQDITIIGAGLMGLWSALELKQRKPHLRITLLERNPVPLGASTRNAGFACFGSPTELLSDIHTMGTDAMLTVAEMRYKGIEKIRSHFTDTQIGLDPCGGYECINKSYEDWNLLPDKIAWLNKLLQPITGIENSFFTNPGKMDAMGLVNFYSLIENTGEAALHSGKLVQVLTQKVQESGIRILNGLALEKWENEGDQIRLFTHNGLQMHTVQLLFCTNAFTQELLPGLSVMPGRGQIIVTTPIPNLPLKGTFHYDKGFYYWRNLDNCIMLGGARNSSFDEEATTELDGTEKIKNALMAFLSRHLHPSFQYQIAHHWSGIMGFTPDHQPLLSMVAPNVYAAIACNGMGVALTPMMAEKVADRLIG